MNFVYLHTKLKLNRSDEKLRRREYASRLLLYGSLFGH